MTDDNPQAPRDPVLELHGTRHPTPTLPSGDQSEVEPPGPIPNPEVKRLSANGSGTIGPVRVGRRQVKARIQLTLGPGSFFAREPKTSARPRTTAATLLTSSQPAAASQILPTIVSGIC